LKNHIGLLASPALFAAMALTATAARAQVTHTGGVYQFHINVHPGTKINYVIIVHSTPPGAAQPSQSTPIAVTTPIIGVVASVQNKIATFKIMYGPSVVNGQPRGEARELEMKVDNRGRPVGAPVPGLENVIGNLPDKPLQVGDSYALEQNINFAGIPFSVNNRYTFLGPKTVKGQRYADFSVAVSGSGNLPGPQGGSIPFKIQGGGSMRIAVSDGLTTHTAGDLNVLINPSANPTKMKVTTTIDRR